MLVNSLELLSLRLRLPPCPLTTQAQHFCHCRPAALQCSKGVALKPPTATALQRGVKLQYSNAANIKNGCLKCNPYLGQINRKRERKCQARAHTETQLADASSKKTIRAQQL